MPAILISLRWLTVLPLLLGLPWAAVQALDAATIAAQGNGRGAAPCVTCHGVDGVGQAAMSSPRLAGLNAAYLLKQLDDFASGARDNPIMTPLATALGTDERQALAEYYSQLPLPEALRASNNITQASIDSVGAILATRGRWSDSIPACEQCHGPRGIGVGAHFPPLAGQPSSYLASQLRAWKEGQRRNDPLGLMGHIAEKLSDSDIDAVANWFAFVTRPIGDKEETP
ncbi:c-type cytochrome [Nitrosococcus watsonii]|uniref:Putative cytochrome c n=1 Tax=Nitrosococcus watsoni (strain C-113) TaxID=105559 RepID=D8KBT0_NITWC|nr:c-type cytochrome [Nitrosococcus watsonii]ADJ27691.1 putative cytochrome c [Nitrosococcus watsonii C-113]